MATTRLNTNLIGRRLSIRDEANNIPNDDLARWANCTGEIVMVRGDADGSVWATIEITALSPHNATADPSDLGTMVEWPMGIGAHYLRLAPKGE
jgi:hypothetical protein